MNPFAAWEGEWLRLCGLAAVAGLAGCGVLGPPIPPEDVGVNPVIERQLRREGLLAPGQTVRGSATRPSAPGQVTIQEEPVLPQGDPLPVPPTRSMGTR